jgi:hypothetical protein
MAMQPAFCKVVLTAHVVTSVAFPGAVAAFLVLDLAGMTDSPLSVATANAMALVGWYAIIPLAIATVLIGVGSSLGTRWGLLRHYWVLVKIVITLPATFLLFLHMQLVDRLAESAAEGISAGDLLATRLQLAIYAVAGIVLLTVATGLSVYKPRGLTPYGLRRLDEQSAVTDERAA